MQCVVLTELHNAPCAFDAELYRKKERLIEFVKCASSEELEILSAILNGTQETISSMSNW